MSKELDDLIKAGKHLARAMGHLTDCPMVDHNKPGCTCGRAGQQAIALEVWYHTLEVYNGTLGNIGAYQAPKRETDKN
jgi:hypothetical protein